MDDRAHSLGPAAVGARGSRRAPRSLFPALGIGGLALFALAWLLWFLIVPLPYANSVENPSGQVVRRGWLLLKAFPHVVPDTTWHQSLLGNGIEELSHVENLPQRMPIVLAAGLIAAAAVGLGDLVTRGLRLAGSLRLGERVALDYGLGAGLLGVITLVVGRLGWLDPWIIRFGLGVLAAAGLLTSRLWLAPRPGIDRSWCWKALVIAPFVVVMILASLLPSIDFDVLEYHLQGPKEYFAAGRIAFLPHNVYTNMPFGVEMLHLLGMEVLDDWWWGGLVGQLLVALFGPAAAILIAGTLEQSGSARAAWIAAIVYLSTPWIYRLAAIAYVEGPLCFYHAAVIWAVVRGWGATGVSRLWLWGLMGLLAGCAMGCKYTALISAVIPFGVVALADSWRARSAAPVGCFILGWAAIMGPWLGKTLVDTGNPVYPLAGGLIGGRNWDEARETQWHKVHGPRPIAAHLLWKSIVEVAGRSDFQSPLYVLLAPLALLRPGSRRLALALWGFVLYLFFTWWLLTHRLDRFWLPMLPVLAVLAGLGADWARSRAWSILLGLILGVSLLMNLIYISTALPGLNEWTGDLVSMRRTIPSVWNPPLFRLDNELPPDARPLLVGQAAVFHLNHPVAYNTVFNPELIEVLASGKSPDELRRALRERNLTHVYVDWHEIQRHRKPGGYGFTDFVTRDRFAGWVAAGVLGKPRLFGPDHELYEVR
jgi:hypothetical protein